MNSGQQIVTCTFHDEKNSFWEIKSPYGFEGPVQFGSIVAFRHCESGKYLHSHWGITSPSTKQQEVCASSFNDSNDYWMITPSGHRLGSLLKFDDEVNIVHFNTNKRLHSHQRTFVLQQEYTEVTCYEHLDKNDNWKFGIGI
jgi:dolichyl-phosphate-mannose--protein O-mannosyl transferase